jgi:hypothetical protein
MRRDLGAAAEAPLGPVEVARGGEGGPFATREVAQGYETQPGVGEGDLLRADHPGAHGTGPIPMDAPG